MNIKGLYSKIKRKGVSPVIATVIIIALVLAATAMVFLVVFPMLNPDFDPILHLDRNQSNFYDYDHDGNCDLMILRLENFGTTDTTITNMTIIATNDDDTVRTNWVPLMEETVELTSKSTKDVYFYAELDGTDEIQPGYSMNIMIWSEDLIIGAFDISNTQFTPGDPVRIEYTDGDGNPISDATLNFYYSTGEFAYSGENTNEQGLSTTHLYPGRYYARAALGLESHSTDVFIHPSGNNQPILLKSSSGILDVQVMSSSTPLSNVEVFLYDIYGNYLSQSSLTNEEGIAHLSVEAGNYKVRAYYMGAYYYSEDISYPDQEQVTIDIGGGNIYCRVIDGGSNPISNIWVYLFTEQGSYTGDRTKTNSTGLSEFTVGLGNYKFRVDYAGYQIWSDIIGASDGSVVDITVGGGVYSNVTDGAGTAVTNVWVYAFTEGGSYTGFRSKTNDTGYSSFNVLPLGENYRFRVDYSGYQIWSDFFTAEYGLVVNVTVGGGLYANVTDGGGNPVTNVWVYAFTEGGSYTGFRSRTNDTGYAIYNVLPLGEDYQFRVDYAGYQIWSEVFTAEYGLVVNITVGGGLYAKITDGGDNPVNNVWVYAFTEGGSYTGFRSRTNDTGYSTFNVLPLGENYRFRVDYAGYQTWSDVFTAEYGLVVNITVGGGLYANVTDGTGNAITNVWVYAFNEDGSYTGFRSRTNDTGYATFNVIPLDENYKFRVDYSGYQIWSDVFTAEYGLVVNITVGGGVYANVTDGGDNAITNVWVYAFNEDGSYTGFRSRTNDTGYATFNVIPLDENYKFRVDYSGYQIWSDVFTAEYGLVVNITVGGGVYANVTDGGDNAITNVWVYAFNEDGSYTGFRSQTNGTGYATFNVLPLGENYRFRVDYSGYQIWSEVFTAEYNLTVNINVGGGVYVHVTDSGEPRTNEWIYAFNEDGSYTGIRERTNSTGYATFNVLPLGLNYTFRVGSGPHSDVYTAEYGLVVEISLNTDPTSLGFYNTQDMNTLYYDSLPPTNYHYPSSLFSLSFDKINSYNEVCKK